ncbi:ABC transporter substrate-binding protein [Roseomonas sp. OT10]|uniref:ABC transporter substrate-binding protein n=1 Tax=Roseomonas cutis TaxID=2897332 RepID=UPI001E4AC837|nr:ABC transporter substrate-binding protein [Roseomonas sp. OT10]UFN47484.1 ABC transporter substrate-binding protein [Roseomonas sp. OT10]
MRRRSLLTATLPALLPWPALAGQVPERPLQIGQAFLAEGLDPVQGSAGWALQSHGVAETLFTVDRRGTAVPNLATGARAEGESWLVSLQAGLRFSDGTPLDAQAAAASLSRAVRGNPRAATGLGREAGFEAVDATTLRIRPARPVAALAPLLAEFPLVIHRPTAAAPVFTGPWRVTGFRAGDRITLESNPHHRDGVARRPAVIRRVADPAALAIGLESGELDLAFGLVPETLDRLRRVAGVAVRSFPVAYQYMIMANTRRPALADPQVRRALSLALDRGQLARALLGGAPASGLFPAWMPWALPDPLPHDRAAAAALLDGAGWPLQGGLRRRDGQVLEVTLAAYPQRPDFLALAPLVRAQWEALGLRVATRVVENGTAALQSGDFDLLFWTTHVAPGGDPSFAFEQYARTGAPLNGMGFSDPALDGVLDRLRSEPGTEARATLAREAGARLNALAPVLFLLTPEWHLGTSARLGTYEPFPSDYYILHAGVR